MFHKNNSHKQVYIIKLVNCEDIQYETIEKEWNSTWITLQSISHFCNHKANTDSPKSRIKLLSILNLNPRKQQSISQHKGFLHKLSILFAYSVVPRDARRDARRDVNRDEDEEDEEDEFICSSHDSSMWTAQIPTDYIILVLMGSTRGRKCGELLSFPYALRSGDWI